MKKINLQQLQNEVGNWSLKNFGSNNFSYRQLLGAIEELGELAHAHLKNEQQIRVNQNHLENKKDAIGDIVIYLLDYCHRENINFEKCIVDAWNIVKKRNWNNNKIDGSGDNR